MPELPEVETTCRGIRPHLINRTVKHVIIRQPKLRWPITDGLAKILPQLVIKNVLRRGKYIIIETCTSGALIIHLGMSGKLSISTQQDNIGKHDHFDLVFDENLILRYQDPRRFGCVLWTPSDYLSHPLLSRLGPEPLEPTFSAKYLFNIVRNKKINIKQAIMMPKIVVGIGNIYANEALFYAGVLPHRKAQSLTLKECRKLIKEIKRILLYAIKRGGTTLKDFLSPNGTPGYFSLELAVYGKLNQPCKQCKSILLGIIINQRSTVYCNICQS